MIPRDTRRFMLMVQNRLGWVPTNDFALEATEKKVAARMAEQPVTYNLRNLTLAVELLAREKETRSPLGVFAHVPRALSLARETESDIETLIHEAVRTELALGDPDGWVVRFARAIGPYRADVYDEWRAGRS